MKNEVKTVLQKTELERLQGDFRVILKWATGVGKSKMAIELVNAAIASIPKPMPKVVFIVAERSHIQNWKDEFTKWGLKKADISIMCYASLHKLRDTSLDILVLDEAHHSFTEKRMSILETINAHYIYALSATLSPAKIMDLESIFGKFTISTVTLKSAIESSILPNPKVNIIEMTLDNTIPNQEITVGKGTNLPEVKWEDRAKYIYKNIPCIIKCTEKQKYMYLTQTMEYWKERYQRSHNEFHHNRWVNLGSQRKRFIGELKTNEVRKLINTSLKNKRFICFCSSVDQAIKLSSRNTISSRKPSYVNQAIIDSFNEKKIQRLYAVGMATEGLNLKDIEVGVIVQLDGKERLFVQKFGRSLRAEDPVAYIFYYKDTQDEVYLKNALENIDNKFINHISTNLIKSA